MEEIEMNVENAIFIIVVTEKSVKSIRKNWFIVISATYVLLDTITIVECLENA